MPLPKAAFQDDSIAINAGLHNDLRQSLGKNFDLFAATTNVKVTGPREKGGHAGPPVKPFKYKPSFPPLTQQRSVAPKECKPIRTTAAFRDELNQILGPSNMKMIEKDIGFVEAPAASAVAEGKQLDRHGNVITGSVYDQAWGASCPRPQYKFDSKPHVTKVHGKFYWPNQTNAEARIPVEIKQPPEVQDLKSWLKMYGEPSPDKIPTGFLTTFRASKKRVGKEKSKSSSMILEATGPIWKSQLENSRRIVAEQGR